MSICLFSCGYISIATLSIQNVSLRGVEVLEVGGEHPVGESPKLRRV